MEEVDSSADPTVQLRARTERLRAAIKAAGGQTLVSNKSGIPLATIRRILANNDTTLGSIIPICAACGVSLDWLATGSSPAGPAPDQQTWSMMKHADTGALGRAVELALRAFAAAEKLPTAKALGGAVSLFYDLDDGDVSAENQLKAISLLLQNPHLIDKIK